MTPMTSIREDALLFDCEGQALPGILSGPGAGQVASGIGVIVVVGGPQYRAGSHRQFVLLARALAARGHHCLRFDYRGMGDGQGPARDFESTREDIGAAIAALRRQVPELRRIVLWGLCDGASASLLHLVQGQAAVDGLCLLNPWVRSDDSLAKTQVKHYYAQRLRQKEFWLKLLRGGTGLAALREFLAKLRTAATRPAKAVAGPLPYQDRMAAAWRSFPGPVLLLLSGDDLVAKEFQDHVAADPAWVGLLDRPGLTRHDLPGIDHTFSSAAWRAEAETLCLAWLDRAFAQPNPNGAP